MDDMWGQIGLGGIVALLVLREVFAFIRSRNGTKPIQPNPHIDSVQMGMLPPSFWLNEFRRIHDVLVEIKQMLKDKHDA